MKFSRLFVLFAILGLAACGGGEAVQPDAPPAETPPPAAQTHGLDQKAPEATVAEEKQPEPAVADVGDVVHFAFDSATIDSEGRAVIEASARKLNANTGAKVTLEGHADERGTREYNLALGERRAKSVERMLKVLGVAGNRIKTVSYGEEKPVEMGQNESAWAANRRVEIIIK